MSSATADSQGAGKPSQPRRWPDWAFQGTGEATIASALADFFWTELERGIQQCVGRDVPPFVASEVREGCRNETCDPHRRWTQNVDTDEKKALMYLARAILQAAGLFDVSVLLEAREDGTLTKNSIIDWILKKKSVRFLTNAQIRWGNNHAALLYGPLRLEAGIVTCSRNDVSGNEHAPSNRFGLLITSRYDYSSQPRALKISRDFKGNICLFSCHLPDGDNLGIPKPPCPIAIVKETIDAHFVDNNSDYRMATIVSAFVVGLLQYRRVKGAQKSSTLLGVSRHIVDDWRNDELNGFDYLVKEQMKKFIALVALDERSTDWSAFGNNCQHFCRKLLLASCFERKIARNRYSNVEEQHLSLAFPEIRKVLAIDDDRSSDISPWFGRYFSSVDQVSMLQFGDRTLQQATTNSKDTRQISDFLLDLTSYAIPTLPSRADFLETNKRLGIPPDDTRDAWFALSAVSLYFTSSQILPPGVAQDDNVHKRHARLALGYYEWLIKAMTPRLMNSILATVFKGCTAEEIAAIRDPVPSPLFDRLCERLVNQGKSSRANELKACRDYEVGLLQKRISQDGGFDWRVCFELK